MAQRLLPITLNTLFIAFVVVVVLSPRPGVKLWIGSHAAFDTEKKVKRLNVGLLYCNSTELFTTHLPYYHHRHHYRRCSACRPVSKCAISFSNKWYRVHKCRHQIDNRNEIMRKYVATARPHKHSGDWCFWRWQWVPRRTMTITTTAVVTHVVLTEIKKELQNLGSGRTFSSLAASEIIYIIVMPVVCLMSGRLLSCHIERWKMYRTHLSHIKFNWTFNSVESWKWDDSHECNPFHVWPHEFRTCIRIDCNYAIMICANESHRRHRGILRCNYYPRRPYWTRSKENLFNIFEAKWSINVCQFSGFFCTTALLPAQPSQFIPQHCLPVEWEQEVFMF